MSKNFLEDVLTLAQVSEKINTTNQNLYDLIDRNRIPTYLYMYKKADRQKRGVYIFSSEFLEYYEKNLKK